MRRVITLLTATLLAMLGASANAPAWGQPPAVPAQSQPPAWYAKGAYVFRVSTPDEADVLPQLEQGHAIVANLLDGTVPQITIVNGLIGHDHRGPWNWDGLWPYWNRATFRAGSFEKLAAFMARAKEKSNVHTGFHLNFTDVNIGLRDYPESRAFFQRLVETQSIYRRDWNNFYMVSIQELYHLGNRSVRKCFDSISHVHLGRYTLTGPEGTVTVAVPDFCEAEWARKPAQQAGRLMIEKPLTTRVNVPRAGRYALKVECFLGGRSDNPQLGVYVNGGHYRTLEHIPIQGPGGTAHLLDAGEIELQSGENTIGFDSGAIRATWTDGTVAEWSTPLLGTGFKARKDDVVFAGDYHRMWPDTWSGQKKIYFFSWDGTNRIWKLPADWGDVPRATLYPLTLDGRGRGVPIAVKDRTIRPLFLPQVPYILVPETQSKENRQ